MTLFERIVECSAASIIVANEEGGVIGWNPAAERLTGIPREEALGMKIWDVMYECSVPEWKTSERKAFFRELIERALQTAADAPPEDTRHYGIPIQRRDGAVRYIERDITRIRWKRRNVLVLTARDMTEWHQAEETLRESQRQFEDIAVNMPGAVFQFVSRADGSMGISYASGHVKEITGLEATLDDYFGLFAAHVVDADRQRLLDSIQQAIAAESPWEFEGQLTKPSGETIWFSAMSTPQRRGGDLFFNGVFFDVTERKRSEEALRTSEERYRNFVSNASEGIFRIDFSEPVPVDLPYDELVRQIAENAIVGEANNAQASMYNATPEQVKGMPVRLFAPDCGRRMAGLVLAKDCRVSQSESQDYDINGHPVWTVQSFRGIVEDGLLKRVWGVQSDITERKKTEEALRQSEARLEALNELYQMTDVSVHSMTQFAMEEAIRLTQSQIGYIAFANQDESTLTMYAWSKEAMRQCEIENKPVVYPVADTGLWGEAIRQRRPVITNDYAAPNPLKRGYPEGHVPILRHMNVPVFDGDRIVIVAGVGNKETDYDQSDVRQLTLLMSGMWRILQRKQAEDALKASEAMLRTVFRAVPLAISVAGPDRILRTVNEGMIEMFGYSREELVGHSARKLYFDDAEYGRVGQVLYGAYQQSNRSSAEAHMRRKDGLPIDLVLNASPLKPGEPSEGVVVTLMDVTARKHLEEQLRQAQKMEAIGQLAGGVAHDFNNLLQAILGYTDMAIDVTPPQSRGHAELSEVRRAAERAANLTRQLLAFSRRQVLQLAPLDLNEAVENLMRMVRRLIGENIELIVMPGHALATVNADRGQIEQVLMNLCVNARDAMPDGGRLTIETRNVTFDASYCSTHEWAKPGRYVMLGVTDSGCGMNEETQRQLFEPFFTTKETGKGTGLGLATVYGIVRQHGGTIQVHSEVNKGAAFRIYLPAAGEPHCSAETKHPEPARGGDETILLAEDEEQVRNLARRVLETAGYRVLPASDGEEAVRLYEECAGQIQLLLLDVVMPRKGGRMVFDEIAAQNPKIKCLFASGYSEEAVHADFVLDSGLHLLQKPYGRDELLRAVRRTLDE